MIVKIQVPLISNAPGAPALIYNEDRSFMVQLPIDEAIEISMKKCKKKYFEAEIVKDKLWIKKEVKAQAW